MVADMYDFQRMKDVIHNNFGIIEITLIPKYIYKLDNLNYLVLPFIVLADTLSCT